MNQALIKRLEDAASKTLVSPVQNVLIEDYKITVLGSDPKVIYIPNKTALEFHSDKSFVRVVRGPYGSGKSSMCCADIILKACAMPAWCSGVRRSKATIIRNTSGDLKATTLQTWLRWFGQIGDFTKNEKPYLTYTYQFNGGIDIGTVELELLFLSIDRPDDFRKLKSLESTWVYPNELSELPWEIIGHLQGRVNHRYPPLDLCPEYECGIISDTNPPDNDHPMYKAFEESKPDGYRMFKQPPGLIKSKDGYIANPDCDNYEHLSPTYYTQLAQGQNEEFIKVFCLGEYGAVITGKRVYPEYNDDFHSSDDVNYIPALPIYLGFDFGLTPAVILCQETARGQLRSFKELVAVDMGIRQFIQAIVKPYMNTELKGFILKSSVGDPAGAARVDTDEQTCMDILAQEGIPTASARTNGTVKRLESVKYYLNRIIDGKPALIISRQGCPLLRKGFLGGYQFRRLAVAGEARYQDVPNKNQYSHPHDAFQYIAMEFNNTEMDQENAKKQELINRQLRNNLAFRL